MLVVIVSSGMLNFVVVSSGMFNVVVVLLRFNA